MKRIYLAGFIFFALCFGGLVNEIWYKHTTEDMIELLSEVSSFAELEEINQAEIAMNDLMEYVEKNKIIFNITSEQSAFESMEMSLHQTRANLIIGNLDGFEVESESLEFLIEHLYEKERFSLNNLF